MRFQDLLRTLSINDCIALSRFERRMALGPSGVWPENLAMARMLLEKLVGIGLVVEVRSGESYVLAPGVYDAIRVLEAATEYMRATPPHSR